VQELAALSPPAEEAQKMQLVVRKGIFSAEEVSKIHQVAQRVRKATAKERKRRFLRHGWIVGQKVMADQHMHSKLYLHAKRCFQEQIPEIHDKLLDLIWEADQEHWHILAAHPHLTVRCAEYHEYNPGGGLRQKRHYDEGSLVTIDVMLSPHGAFQGGELGTCEPGGLMKMHNLDSPGDVAIFPSHKYDSVEGVTKGM